MIRKKLHNQSIPNMLTVTAATNTLLTFWENDLIQQHNQLEVDNGYSSLGSYSGFRNYFKINCIIRNLDILTRTLQRDQYIKIYFLINLSILVKCKDINLSFNLKECLF